MKSNLPIKNFPSRILIPFRGEEKSNYYPGNAYQLHLMSPFTKLFMFNWLHSSKTWRRLMLQIIKYSGSSCGGASHSVLVLWPAHCIFFSSDPNGAEGKNERRQISHCSRPDKRQGE